MFSVCVCVCVFVGLCTGRSLETSWSPVQGVLPTVPDQETEETQPCAPKSGCKLPSVGATRKGKNILAPSSVVFFGFLCLSLGKYSFWSRLGHRICEIVFFASFLVVQGKYRIVPVLGYDCFRPNTFQFTAKHSTILITWQSTNQLNAYSIEVFRVHSAGLHSPCLRTSLSDSLWTY
jgi:hypothetical protein